jgi:DmsE family decaheme c-type cytochrome
MLALAAWAGAAAPASSDTAYDVNDCKACHEKAVTAVQATQHGGVVQGCAACHGSVMEHLRSNLDKGEPGPIASMNTKKRPAAEVNATCLQCHEKGHQAQWAGSAHERRGVACTSCHSVHDPKSDHGQLKTARDAETCASCHPQVAAKTRRVSHHPVREGLMSCSSCHNPHDGTQPKMLAKGEVNEQCYACHAEKRGPVFWEHAPVRENCLHCHDAHGSNHEKLLVAKQPYLCQRCHLNTRHPGTLYDLRNTLAGPSTSNRAIEHGCKNCHQNIHGTNAPSGPYLGR